MKKYLLPLCLVSALYAEEDINSSLSKLGLSSVEQYVGPIASGFAADLNSGWMTRLPSQEKFALDLELSLIGMASPISDMKKDFSVKGNFNFNREQAGILVDQTLKNLQLDPLLEPLRNTIRDSLINQIVKQNQQVEVYGPTAAGSSKDSVKVKWNGAKISVDGQDYDLASAQVPLAVTGFAEQWEQIGARLPLIAPQLRIGTLFGTNAQFRYLPEFEIDKLGTMSYFGWGVSHNLTQYIPQLPIDLALNFNTQSFQLGRLFEFNTMQYGLWFGKKVGWTWLNLQPFGGISFETGDLQISWDIPLLDNKGLETGKSQTLTLKMPGANDMRSTLGLSARLGIFDLSIEQAFANQSVTSAKVGLIF